MYWMIKQDGNGYYRMSQYFMDADADVANLPTSQAAGTVQQDGTSHLPTGRGSIAMSLESGTMYILNSNDEWIEQQ